MACGCGSTELLDMSTQPADGKVPVHVVCTQDVTAYSGIVFFLGGGGMRRPGGPEPCICF